MLLLRQSTANYVSFDALEGKEGKTLLLHGLQFTPEPVKDGCGQGTSFPVTLVAGELVKLEEIPERQREELVERRDYC
jgi:hypothetical protein